MTDDNELATRDRELDAAEYLQTRSDADLAVIADQLANEFMQRGWPDCYRMGVLARREIDRRAIPRDGAPH